MYIGTRISHSIVIEDRLVPFIRIINILLTIKSIYFIAIFPPLTSTQLLGKPHSTFKNVRYPLLR